MPLNLPFQPQEKTDVSPSLVPNRGPYYRGDYNPETLQNYWLHHYQAQQAMQSPDSPPLASYWEQPQIISRYYNLLRTAPPTWQPPDWLDTNKITAVYDYMKERYKDIPVAEWKPLPYDDPAADILRSMPLPTYQNVLPTEYKYLKQPLPGAQNNVLTDAQVKAQQPIDWSDLDNPEYKWMRTYLSLFAPQAEGIENRPEWSKLSASAVQSLMLGLGAGVAVGSFTGPIGGVIAGLATAGLLTYQNYTGNKVPLLNDIMRPFNWLAEGAEATIGMASLAKQEGYDEVFDSLEDAYRTGLLEYETWKASNIPNWIAKVDDALRPNYDITTADKNEVWKISSGNLKPVEAPYGKGGEALAHYHQWIESGQANDEYQAALETGYDGRYQEFIYQRVMEEYGDTAISNDIVWQTVLDPLNVLPWAIGKSGGAIAGKIASTADNATVARTAGQIEGAFKQGTGNILIDALPPGIQQIAEAITGVQSSKGLLQTYNLYKDWIRTGFIPANMKQHAPDLQAKYKQLLKDGVKQTDISILDDTLTWTDKRGIKQSWQGKQGATIKVPELEELSNFEKFIGGIDTTYGTKEMIPTKGLNYFQKLSKETPESQVLHSLHNFHYNLDSLLNEIGNDPNKIVEYIEKLAGIKNLEETDILSGMMKSASTRTFQGALKYALDDKDFLTNYLSTWVLGEERRMMLNKIAMSLDPDPKKKIEIKVAETLELLKNKPEVLAQHLNKIAPELGTTPDVLKATLDVFIGKDALPSNFGLFRVNLINTIAKKMDDYYVNTYGLKPDSWVFRISNVLKGVQSLLLLGFNPAYLMNNWVNNTVTRAVDGVGGYMTPRQMVDFYERLGIFPKDSGLTGYDEIVGAVVKQAQEAKDIISIAQRGVSKANKIGIFSRLSGRIEKLEGMQTQTIAIRQFLSNTKKVGAGIRRMPLVVENALDSRYPGMKEKVYAAIGAGLNIKEIENSLFNTEVKPQVENMIDKLDQKYRNGQGGSVRELFDKMNLTDNLRDELMNAKTDMEIDLAFKNVEDRLTDWIEKAHAEELFTLSEESKNLTQSERIPYVLSVHGDMIIDEAMKHITGRQAWEVLYAKKMAGQFTPEQWTKEVKYLDAKQRAEMKRTNERRLQTYKGIIQSMGIDNESSRTFVIKLGEFNDVWKTYWDGRARLYDEYYQTIDKRKGETLEQRNSRIDGLYEKLQEQQEKLYDAAVKAELAIQTDMDTMFAKMYEDYTGWDVTPAVKGRADLRKMREEMTNMQKEMRKTTKGLTPDQIDAEYAKMNPVYNQIIAKMKQFEHDLSYKLMNKPVPEVRIEVPVVEKPVVVPEPEGNPNLEPMTPADLTINPDNLALLKEEAINAGLKPELADGLDGKGLSNYINEMKGRETRAAKAAAEQAKIDKMKDVVKAKTVAEDIFAQADRVLKEKATHAELVRNKADYLAQTRKAYKNVSEEKFALFEKFSDRVIDQWAIRNGYTPSDEIRNAWYATRIAKVERGYGELGKGELPAEGLKQVDTSTSEFKAWFGDSKAVNSGGNPKEVYRGDIRNKTIFTGRESNDVIIQGNIFFVDKPDVAKFYTPIQKYWMYDASELGASDGFHRVYLSTQNPLEIDARGNGWASVPLPKDLKHLTYDGTMQIDDLAVYAREHGYDGLIVKNVVDQAGKGTQYVVFNPEQVKSVFNRGTWDVNDPNYLHQGESPKGSYQIMENAGAVIRAFESADFSTMVHEMFHVWLPDLSDADFDSVAKLGGLKNGAELRDLEARFRSGELVKGMPDYDRYVNTVEQFARGGEQYIASGDAPTPALKSLFRKFSDWMLEIYQALTRKNGRVSGYENTPLKVNINVKVDGVSLKDVFDRMLTDKVDRPKSIGEMIRERINTMKDERGYRRLDEQGIQTAAGKALVKDILGNYKSADDAMKAADGLTDYVRLADGSLVDDAVIYDALEYMNAHHDTNPWTAGIAREARSAVTPGKYYTYGIADPERKYNMTYKVVDLNDLIASDNVQGNNIVPNPNFPQEYQGRITTAGKGEVSQRMGQITEIARTLNPELLLRDNAQANQGAPVVTSKNEVLGGNGRVNSLQYALQEYPDRWQAYQQDLPRWAAEAGIEPDAYKDMQNPVLVRELDPNEDAAAFAEDTNKPVTAVMSSVELAMGDAGRISPDMLRLLDVLEGEDIYESLKRAGNSRFVNKFLEKLTVNERQGLITDGTINQEGTKRIVNALIATVFDSTEGERMLNTFAASIDSNIKTIQNAVMASLPQLALLEGQIKYGMKPKDFSIADDIAWAANKIDALRKSGNMNAAALIDQIGLFGESPADTMTPVQKMLLPLFESKAPKKIREALRKYVYAVDKQPNIGQTTLSDLVRSKEQILNDAINGRIETAEQGNLLGEGQPRTDAETTGSVPLEELARPTTEGGLGTTPEGSESLGGMAGKVPEVGAETHRPVESGEVQPAVTPAEIAKSVISTQAKAEYDAGQPVPLDRAQDIDLAHEEVMPVPEEINGLIELNSNSYKFEYKQAYKDYMQWIIDGEKGKPPVTDQQRASFDSNISKQDLERLRNYASQKASGVEIVQEAKENPLEVSKKIDAKQEARADIVIEAFRKAKYIPREMTRSEFVEAAKKVISPYDNRIFMEDILYAHKREVENVPDWEGSVRPEVLKDYPNLGTKPESKISQNGITQAQPGLLKDTNGNTLKVFHGTNEKFTDYQRVGEKIPALGLGHYFTTNVDKANRYGKYLHEANLISSKLLDWNNLLDIDKQKIINRLNDTVPENEIAGYGKVEEMVFKEGQEKEALAFYEKKKKETASYYHDRAKAFNDINDDGDAVVRWMTPGLENASSADLLAVAQRYDNNIALELGYDSAKYGDEIVVFDSNQIVEIPTQPGINIKKVYKFKHGDVDCVANVYKDGELIAYMPAVPLKDARIDENTRILGLDPQFPDKVVYEQDGVIKTVDMRKPEVDNGQAALFQNAETRTDTPEFKTWFGNSKAVDADGNPLWLYHQTSKNNETGIFKTGFDINKKGARASDPEVPDGIFLKPDDKNIFVGAAEENEISQIPLRASLQNPLIVKNRGELTRFVKSDYQYYELLREANSIETKGAKEFDAAWEEMREFERGSNGKVASMDNLDKILQDWTEKYNSVATKARERLTTVLKEHGYDSVIIEEDAGSFGRKTKTYIALEPEQVKSVFNRGTWDRNNPNILYQSGQTDFFSNTADDLPLFSGTPMKAEDMLFAPKEASPQMSMFPDIVPEAKPTRIIEIQVKEKGGTSYIRLDLKKTKAIRDTLALHKGEEMTARILDANGKVVESNVDPNQVVNPTFGSNALFQIEDISTPEQKIIRAKKIKERITEIINAIAEEDLNKLMTIEDANQFKDKKQLLNMITVLDTTRINDLPDPRIRKIFSEVPGLRVNSEELYSIEHPYTQEFIKPYSEYPEDNQPYNSTHWDRGREVVDYSQPERTYENMSFIGNDENYSVSRGRKYTITKHGDGNYKLEYGSSSKIFNTWEEARNFAINHAKRYNRGELFQDGFAEQPGGVEQFREYNEQPIDVQRMSDAPMGEVPLNGTPVTEPFSRTLDEINSEHLRPMMDELKDMYKKAMKEDTPFKFGDLADEDKKAIRKYLDNDVRSDLASVKRAALSYGDMMRNNAMLDYGRRYGFDNVLGTVFPYQFWYTRSMMNWAKRMVDKPSWFAMYARMKQTQERMEQENMPTRLRGKMRINMPWMPEWMGGGLWTDPMSKVFPFQQFGQPFEQYAMNKNQLNKAAEYIVEDMRSAEKITPAEAEQAISTKTGVIWERAMAQAEIEEGKSSSPASLVGMMMQPALWWQIPLNMANENRAETGPLPITRTGQTIKELGKNTFLQPITNMVGGALAAPETAIRRSKGLSEFGQWGDYYIDRTIAGMAADGEITADQARIAMIERTGDIFAEATSRVSQEQALRTPGAAGIMALKSGKPIQAIPAFIGSIFGGSLFSEGELKMRGLKPVYDNAWKKFEAGDDQAINQFFEDYPEYEARLALYDEPEDRLHQFLIDSVWRKYMALDKQNKYMAVEALGEDFELSFLDKETRSYETISDKTLATWSQMLGKSEMPKVEAVAGAEKAKEISYYDQRTLKAIDAYRTEKESRFKNVNVWQEAYFALPVGAQRKAFLQQHPELKAYWDWKDEYSRTHPEIAPYFKELQNFSTGDQVSSELSSPLIRQILTLATGGTLSAGAKNELERIRMMYAPDMDEEQFIGLVLSLVLAGGVQ